MDVIKPLIIASGGGGIATSTNNENNLIISDRFNRLNFFGCDSQVEAPEME